MQINCRGWKEPVNEQKIEWNQTTPLLSHQTIIKGSSLICGCILYLYSLESYTDAFTVKFCFSCFKRQNNIYICKC